MRTRLAAVSVLAVLGAAAVALSPAAAAGAAPDPAFTNTPLIVTGPLPPGVTTAPNANSLGNSEPGIAFAKDGSMAIDSLTSLPQVNLWQGHFGATPAYFGGMDAGLSNTGVGRTTSGGADADVEFTSAGTILLADLNVILNRNGRGFQIGVNATRCPAGTAAPSDCTHTFIDTAGADRPWITTAGTNAWLAYHDSKNSSLIRVKRSTDDGKTWSAAGSPIPGQGAATGDATFNNEIGPIVADPGAGVVYESYAAGEPQTKAKSANYNNIYVSRSADGGKHWTSKLVFHAPPLTRLNNFFPALAVDPVTHAVYAAWTDQHGVDISQSTDGGVTWSPAVTVSSIQTTVMPWVAARNGKVDVVYYGSTAASPDDTAAVWNVYDSQFTSGAWAVKKVSNTPNRVGAICLEGSACTSNRELLDLFQVAEDPLSGKAAVIYTDSTIDTFTDSNAGVTGELPEIVLAFEQ